MESDQKLVEFGKFALDNLQFLYKRADSDDKKVGDNLIFNHSALMLDAEISRALPRRLCVTNIRCSLHCN